MWGHDINTVIYTTDLYSCTKLNKVSQTIAALEKYSTVTIALKAC